MKHSEMSGEFIHFSKLISTISRSSGGSFLKNTLFTVPSLVGGNGGHDHGHGDDENDDDNGDDDDNDDDNNDD